MKKLFLLVGLCLLVWNVNAQITVNFTNVEDWIKTNFVGQGVVVGNIKTHLPSKEAAGTFSSTGVLKINNGLVMSTGDIRRIPSLNDKYNESTGFNLTGSAEKDPDLMKFLNANFFDISFIEFDFVPYNNSIEFNYQFGSEEYPEYVGSVYNDVFAFIVSDEKGSQNIALIPGKKTPVSINTVNFKTDSIYYIDNNVFKLKAGTRDVTSNEPYSSYERTSVGKILYSIKKFFTPREEGSDLNRQEMEPDDELVKKVDDKLYRNLQFDGITTKLVAQTYVEPYKKYHLKIIIADVGDNVYDSGVFLEKGSLMTVKDEKQPGFVDYQDLSKVIDPQKILNGENIKNIPVPSPNNKPNKEPILSRSEMMIKELVVYFDFDKDETTSIETAKINEIAKIINQLGGNYSAEIIGHTDNKGNLKYNIDLAEARAEHVSDCLKSIIPGLKKVSTSSKAYLQPIETNETENGRALNRRVTVKFTKER
ncbi:MAG: OmpA family protein [Pelobium sp.]